MKIAIDVDDLSHYVTQRLVHDDQFHDIFFTRISNTPTFTGNQLKDAIRISMKEYVKKEEQKHKELKFSIDEMYYILVKHGQKDPQFKFGDTIKYSPSEIKSILLKEVQKGDEEDA